MTNHRRRRVRRIASGLFACALAAGPLAAQQYADLTTPLAAEYVEFHNAASTSRVSGEVVIAPSTELSGDVAILNGPLVVQGTLSGRVLVVNGDVILEPSALVVGRLVVIGGDVQGMDLATVEAEVRVHREPLEYRRIGDAIALDERRPITGLRAARRLPFGNTAFTVAVDGAYNRVEGLPVALGPRLSLGRSNPTVLEALLLYRSAGGFTLERRQIGYRATVEQYLGGHGRWSVGAALRSEVDPIETNGISDTESSLATFLLHRDYRDHYEREGWSGWIRWTNDRRALDATLAYVDEQHHSRASLTPWTLFDNGEEFRPQPMVGEGTLRSIRLAVEHDSRNERRDPSSGWWIRFDMEQGVGGAMRVPVSQDGDGTVTPSDWSVDTRFSALAVDARRYLRVDPVTRVAVRGWLSGSLDGGPLPPQRQQALGGEGSMPGFDMFQLDCGARDATGAEMPGAPEMYAYYGCDRAALGQLSIERSLSFLRPIGSGLGLDFDFGATPALVVFGDVGRAWIEDGSRRGRGRGSDDLSADAGVGFRFGRLGVYWALPLTGSGRAVNFFVRIGPRI